MSVFIWVSIGLIFYIVPVLRKMIIWCLCGITGAGLSMPFWDFMGSTVITSSYIRLTSDLQSKSGSIWNAVVCLNNIFGPYSRCLTCIVFNRFSHADQGTGSFRCSSKCLAKAKIFLEMDLLSGMPKKEWYRVQYSAPKIISTVLPLYWIPTATIMDHIMLVILVFFLNCQLITLKIVPISF